MQVNQAQDPRKLAHLDQVLQCLIHFKLTHLHPVLLIMAERHQHQYPQKLAFLGQTPPNHSLNSLTLSHLKSAGPLLIPPSLAPLTLALVIKLQLAPIHERLATLLKLACLFDFQLKFLGWLNFLTRDSLIPNLSLKV